VSGVLTQWRNDTVHDGSPLHGCISPQLGSGIAAKQYDPGAPFFLGLVAMGYWLLAALTKETLLEDSGGSIVSSS
jgi:hypothetical protein